MVREDLAHAPPGFNVDVNMPPELSLSKKSPGHRKTGALRRLPEGRGWEARFPSREHFGAGLVNAG
jgi:hypothetical protein